MTQIGWIFPGQGSQTAGMGKKYAGRAAFDNVIDICEDVTGKPVRQYLEEMPAQDLVQTDRAQLAIFSMSMGIAYCLKEEGFAPDFVAGHSLGHFTALAMSGVLSLEQAAKLVSVRGQLMLAAGRRKAGGMGVIQRLDAETVAQLFNNSGLKVWLANLNLQDQIVVSGAADNMDSARQLVTAAGGRWTSLNVSGAFHSPLLNDEAAIFSSEIQKMEFKAPECPVISNRNAYRLITAKHIQNDLLAHMTSQVCWTSVMNQIANQAPAVLVEVGPGKVLTGLMLRHKPELKPQSTGVPALLSRTVLALQAISSSTHIIENAA